MKIHLFLLLIAIPLLSFSLARGQAPDPLSYFKDNYEECDRHFTEIFTRLNQINPKAEIHQFLYPQGSIKSYFIPATESADNLLIMISGTHGIEAFAGSAIQRHFLEQNPDLRHTSVLLIHGFNLYGFKNYRRVNENNVDLNRSFILNRDKFRPDDQKYTMLNSFLNPVATPVLNVFSLPTFIVESVIKIARYSMDSLRSSVLKGQYSYPDGVFYGGKEPAPQELLIDQLTERYLQDSYKKVVLIDLHTGYGERSRLRLLAGKTAEPNSQQLNKIFGAGQVDFSDKKDFYAVEGEMLVYFSKKISGKSKAEIGAVTFEFGTMDSQKTLGSIESLRRVILENQNFHHPADSDTASEIKSLYREMFYPSDPLWRSAVLKQADERLKTVFKYLNSL